MNPLFIMLCPIHSSWSNVINSIPCLCYCIIACVALYLLLHFIGRPWLDHYFEQKARAQAFKLEKDWADLNKANNVETDENLKKQNQQLEGENENLKIEKKILDEQLKTYNKFFTQLQLELKPKSEQPKITNQ